MKEASILLVEDVRVNAMVAAKLISTLGHKVEVALDGNDAIKKLQEDDYDVVFMDIEMPGLNGFEATRKIRSGAAGEKAEDIPIFAMTAYTTREIHNESSESGMNGFIEKPLKLTEVKKLLEELS
ncbi:MAG: response regulator [Spirochaetales bacterium]|nr:response regulator [Spirochaetales bacterium]MCF7939688.1 response regulator [Spirochaetales bacterium]